MIEIKSINIAYGLHRVLEDISFCVERGQKLGIYGPSASGKSSILRCILGFVEPQSGSIQIGGVELTGKSVWSLRRQISYVPQESDLGSGTVQQVIDRPFSYHSNHRVKDHIENLPELLKKFGLPQSILAKDIVALSGGEKQRIALIIALLLDRPILLLDEVSSALDPKCKQAVVDYLSDSSHTAILVTHDSILHQCCDSVVSLEDLKGQRI